MSIDVTDATFPTEVVERSRQVPVVVDLWAEWCGPCKTLGPILEKVIDETGGKVILAKVDVDTNQQTAAAFQVQGIPAVYALRDGKVVDGFVGAQGEAVVREFVSRLLPTEAEDALAALLAAGDEASLRQVLAREPGHEQAIVSLAELLVKRGGEDDKAEALALLERALERVRPPETANERLLQDVLRLIPRAHPPLQEAEEAGMVLEQDAEHARRLRIVLGGPGGYWHPHPQVQATSAQGQSTPQAQPHPQAQP